jgi:hypothetical protein
MLNAPVNNSPTAAMGREGKQRNRVAGYLGSSLLMLRLKMTMLDAATDTNGLALLGILACDDASPTLVASFPRFLVPTITRQVLAAKC